MRLWRELGLAMALATRGERRIAAFGVAERTAALAWLPLCGLGVGAVAAIAAAVLGAVPAAATLVAVGILRAADGGAVRPLALAVAAGEWLALGALAPPARSIALCVAPMLARWARVVQCYGGAPGPAATGLAALAGRARFREFGLASVTALGLTLLLLDAVGLAVVVGCALVTLGIRLVAYRTRGGIDDRTLAASGALVELGALVLLAGIAVLLRGR
jgi:hypothetical protein